MGEGGFAGAAFVTDEADDVRHERDDSPQSSLAAGNWLEASGRSWVPVCWSNF